jgi:hypothetical protein
MLFQVVSLVKGAAFPFCSYLHLLKLSFCQARFIRLVPPNSFGEKNLTHRMNSEGRGKGILSI